MKVNIQETSYTHCDVDGVVIGPVLVSVCVQYKLCLENKQELFT